MTQGIFTSLNLTLARLDSIESNFSALQGISNELNARNFSSVQKNDGEFKNILDKLAQKPKKETVEEKIEKLIESSPLDDDINILKKEAVNLKSKIDLAVQKADIDDIIDTFSDKYGIDGDFIKAIIKQESGFNVKAQSKKGAMGLMQLMPATAKELGVVDAFNPWENIEGGVRYLKGLMDKFNGDKKLALAAYNAGPGAVKRYGGIPPYKETQNYVNGIMGVYEKLQSVKGGNS